MQNYNLSSANQNLINQRVLNQQQSNSQAYAPTKNNDEFIKSTKTSKAKIAIIAVGAALCIGLLAFLFKDKLVDKIKKFIPNFKNKTTPQPKITPEAIVKPTNSGYDLSKEVSAIDASFYNTYEGYSSFTLGKYPDNYLIDKNSPAVGITPDGFAYVRADFKDLRNLCDTDESFTDFRTTGTKFLDIITLISPNSEFTPAMKNLIAILHQQDKLTASSHSMLLEKNSLIMQDNPGIADILEKLSCWAQDINENNEETQKILGAIPFIKKGEHFYTINQLIKNFQIDKATSK